MPNWCGNAVTFTHADPAMIQRVVRGFTGEGLMQEFVPCPDDLLSTVKGSFADGDPRKAENDAKCEANQAKHGYPTWYEWKLAKWGTKWDVSNEDSDLEVPEDATSVDINFDSAWSPPIEFYGQMEALGFKVTAYYWEPGMNYCGQYADGENHEEQLSEMVDLWKANPNARPELLKAVEKSGILAYFEKEPEDTGSA